MSKTVEIGNNSEREPAREKDLVMGIIATFKTLQTALIAAGLDTTERGDFFEPPGETTDSEMELSPPGLQGINLYTYKNDEINLGNEAWTIFLNHLQSLQPQFEMSQDFLAELYNKHFGFPLNLDDDMAPESMDTPEFDYRVDLYCDLLINKTEVFSVQGRRQLPTWLVSLGLSLILQDPETDGEIMAPLEDYSFSVMILDVSEMIEEDEKNALKAFKLELLKYSSLNFLPDDLAKDNRDDYLTILRLTQEWLEDVVIKILKAHREDKQS